MNIVLLVGPSGSGKDSLLRLARRELAGDTGFAFARRYITRPPDQSEDNYYIDAIGFTHLRDTGFFLSTWQAHGNCYGIAEHLFDENCSYNTLICSVSRMVIDDFETRYPHAVTIEVTVPREVLEKRLHNRGRENMDDIAGRLRRSSKPMTARNRIRFDNSLPLEQSGPAFITLLKGLDFSLHHGEKTHAFSQVSR